MVDSEGLTIAVVVWILASVVGLAILYFVIKGAVLAALREHTTSSTTGVSIVSSVPLWVANDGTPAE